MKKVRLIILIVLLCVLGGITIVSFWGSRNNSEMTDTIKLVPVDANLLLEIRNFKQLTNSLNSAPLYWEVIQEFPAIKSLSNHIHTLDTLSNTDKNIADLLEENSIIISIHDVGRNKLAPIFYSPIPTYINQDKILKEIESIWGNETSKSREYDTFKIHEIKSKKKKYSYSIIGGHLVFSTNTLLIEDVIRQSNIKSGIFFNKNFQKVYRTAGEKEILNIYINLQEFNKVLSPFFNPNKINNNKAISDYASWVALDLSLKETVINLNGFAVTQDSTMSYLNHIQGQEEQSMIFSEILPENTAMFYSQNITNFKSFKKCRKEFLNETHYPGYFETKIKKYNQKLNGQVDQLIFGLTESQVCFAVSNFNLVDLYQNSYLLLNTQSASRTQQMLEHFISDYCEETSHDLSDYIKTIKTGNEREFIIYQFPIGNWAGTLFGDFFSQVNASHCVVIDNFLIFGRNINSLTRFINSYLLSKTLNKSPKFQEYNNNLAKKSQASFYINISKATPWIYKNLTKQNSKKLSKFDGILKQFSEFTIQQIVSEDMIYHNIALQYRPYNNDAPHTIWERRVDQPILKKPSIVKNHYSKEKEILVQDQNNFIYLIDKSGIILWKAPVEGPILSKIHQVDIYKNNKLQYLFNTKNKIYLIDRNGNSVDNFPILLRSPASCGISLFDYENNRDYRICVPTENKNIYLYNIKGNLINGWNFKGSEHPITTTIQHIKNNKKDYIVFHDKYKIYILDRRGKIRVQPKENFPASNNKFWHSLNKNASKACITTTKSDGQVYHIYLDGSIERISFGEYGENHQFCYKDIDSDGIKDYIFLDKNKLEVFNKEKELIFDYTFKNNIEEKLSIYQFSSKNIKIGVVDKMENEIYLINKNGKLHTGFPLTGSTQFSITQLKGATNHFNLFVGGKENFLYNYEVK